VLIRYLERGADGLLSKLSDSNFTGSCDTSFVKLNTLDFMKGLSLKIALPTVWAGYDRDVLNNEHVLPFTVSSCNPAITRTLFPADFTYHLIHSTHFEGI
jgi:hypothetical protein